MCHQAVIILTAEQNDALLRVVPGEERHVGGGGQRVPGVVREERARGGALQRRQEGQRHRALQVGGSPRARQPRARLHQQLARRRA